MMIAKVVLLLQDRISRRMLSVTSRRSSSTKVFNDRKAVARDTEKLFRKRVENAVDNNTATKLLA